MKRVILHMALLLTVLLAAGCTRISPFQFDSRLEVTIRIPAPVTTRADVGSVTPGSTERKLTSLQVWIFKSSDGTFLGYLEPDVSTFADGEEERLFIRLDNEMAKTRPNVDVYAIANAAGIPGLSLDQYTTRVGLDNALIQGESFFGSGIPLAGLPYSGVKTCSLTGNYPVLNAGSVTLTQAVSKIRFLFSQLSAADGTTPLDNFTVTSIGLDGNLIPGKEYVFNTSTDPYRVGSEYVADGFNFTVPADPIPACPSPADYAFYSGQSSSAYENVVAQGIQDGKLLSTPYYYFRESPLALSGTIRYTVGGVSGTIPFVMHAAGDFTRGHSWVVYVYYASGRIQFSVTYEPWENGGDIPVNGDDNLE